MNKFKCSICGYTHDEAKDGSFESLPEDWVCPLCKAKKHAFNIEGSTEKQTKIDRNLLEGEDKELTHLELSAICSNLARGCEKQYLNEEAEEFKKLADYLKTKSKTSVNSNMKDLLELVEKDLNESFPLVEAIAKENNDRGALRAYTWSIKVTMILQSLLERYQEVGDEMLENTGVYVCTICGFIYIGNELPELCPICKVPNYKFTEIGGE